MMHRATPPSIIRSAQKAIFGTLAKSQSGLPH